MSKLYLVPTPIGNLEDITLRAIRILKESDLILAEDTRTSGKLLKHFEIATNMMAFHMHNEHQQLENVIGKLKNGLQIAVITDAGTPGISDPGFLLTRACLQHQIEVECLPGATALIPALVNSGFPSDRFVFEGFIPIKKGRQTRFLQLAEETRTLIFYESPHKLLKTLSDFGTYFGEEREISVSRELTKLYEETVRGTVSEVLNHFKKKAPKGEFVLVVKGKLGNEKIELD
ncbi:MAG: 16S rRNA (cytidine(1402)-2'-O)-methyltransferase [Bacteroidetes bacterium]|nr:16S rRNA (cytidine(1402)-2'-O)-methyltransferase [Bacteroidota bacterium]